MKIWKLNDYKARLKQLHLNFVSGITLSILRIISNAQVEITMAFFEYTECIV